MTLFLSYKPYLKILEAQKFRWSYFAMVHYNYDGSITAKLRELRVEATKQGETVRLLKKANGTSSEVLKLALEKLTSLRKEIGDIETTHGSHANLFSQNRAAVENLLKRRFFVVPAYEIYGGAGGLFDLGPSGCNLKSAVESLWRSHFILEDDMMEISGPCLTPYMVFKASGHVDRFTDLMVKDTVTQECFRADKYLEEQIDVFIGRIREKQNTGDLNLNDDDEIHHLEIMARQADSLSQEEMKSIYAELSIKSPKGNLLSDPYPFNLMFGVKIGPSDSVNDTNRSANNSHEGKAFLRPETAQGIFVNFKRLYEQNNCRLPFAAATLGLGFRNEIAPRNGLLRVREFQMGEIEHFCHPKKKNNFPKFENIKNINLPIFSRERQLTDGLIIHDMSLEAAVADGIVDNKTLGYFLARSYLFIQKCGIKSEHVRFRQHLKSEMSHYASDCWDLEIETSYGWIEVAGHADRSAYDLTNHARVSKVDLVAMERFSNPRVVDFVKVIPDKQLIGKTFRQKQTLILESLEQKDDSEKLTIEEALVAAGEVDLKLCDGHTYTLTRDMCRFEKTSQKVSEESFIPGVIEPSFGIGRILHCIMEHAYYSRGIEDQDERVVLAFPPLIAPTKVTVLPLSNNAAFNASVSIIRDLCVKNFLTFKVDASAASIGKRYARNDEIGTPFAITVDFDTLNDGTVTLRERDSMQQIRVPIDEAFGLVKEMCHELTTWDKVIQLHSVLSG